MSSKVQVVSNSQSQKFKALARELECNTDEATFKANLTKIARRSPKADQAVVHASDCALHNAPALEPGPCDCGAIKAHK
jgi:hypothetical protein